MSPRYSKGESVRLLGTLRSRVLPDVFGGVRKQRRQQPDNIDDFHGECQL